MRDRVRLQIRLDYSTNYTASHTLIAAAEVLANVKIQSQASYNIDLTPRNLFYPPDSRMIEMEAIRHRLQQFKRRPRVPSIALLAKISRESMNNGKKLWQLCVDFKRRGSKNFSLL